MVGDSSQRMLCARAFRIVILSWNSGLLYKHNLFVPPWIPIFNLWWKLLPLTPERRYHSLDYTLSALAVIQLQQATTAFNAYPIVDVTIHSLIVNDTPLAVGIFTSCDSPSGCFCKTTSNNAERTSQIYGPAFCFCSRRTSTRVSRQALHNCDGSGWPVSRWRIRNGFDFEWDFGSTTMEILGGKWHLWYRELWIGRTGRRKSRSEEGLSLSWWVS